MIPENDNLGVLDASMFKPLDGGPSFTIRHRIHRAVWNLTWFWLASWTPPIMHPWRRTLLVLFGANMAPLSDVRGGAKVWYPPNLTMSNHTILADGVNCYNMAPISIGECSIVSQRAFLCGGSHDFTDPNMQLVARPIVIESNCWIATEAFIGPGVKMNRGAILGARAVTFRDLDAWTIYAGNPARQLRRRA